MPGESPAQHLAEGFLTRRLAVLYKAIGQPIGPSQTKRAVSMTCGFRRGFARIVFELEGENFEPQVQKAGRIGKNTPILREISAKP
jgi:hypothetical protein